MILQICRFFGNGQTIGRRSCISKVIKNFGTWIAYLLYRHLIKKIVTLANSLVLLTNISSFSSASSLPTTALNNAGFYSCDQLLNKLTERGIGRIEGNPSLFG
jgi:hypothetical protein